MNKNLIGSLILGAGMILWFMFGMPQYDEWKADKKILNDRVQFLADAKIAQSNIGKLSKDYAEQEATIKKVLLALPKQKQYDYITSSLQAVAAESGMQLSEIVLSDTKGKEDYQTVQVKVEVTGRYLGFLDLLNAIERSLRLYDITKIDVATMSTVGAGGLVTATLQISAYSLK